MSDFPFSTVYDDIGYFADFPIFAKDFFPINSLNFIMFRPSVFSYCKFIRFILLYSSVRIHETFFNIQQTYC